MARAVDLDIVARDAENLQRGLNFMLTTTAGDLDLLGEIAGGGGYEQLSTHAQRVSVFETEVAVVTLAQLIHLKRAAGRPKDLARQVRRTRGRGGDTWSR